MKSEQMPQTDWYHGEAEIKKNLYIYITFSSLFENTLE